jgi:hypothetical protein
VNAVSWKLTNVMLSSSLVATFSTRTVVTDCTQQRLAETGESGRGRGKLEPLPSKATERKGLCN